MWKKTSCNLKVCSNIEDVSLFCCHFFISKFPFRPHILPVNNGLLKIYFNWYLCNIHHYYGHFIHINLSSLSNTNCVRIMFYCLKFEGGKVLNNNTCSVMCESQNFSKWNMDYERYYHQNICVCFHLIVPNVKTG